MAGARRLLRRACEPGRFRPARHADVRAHRGRAEARLDRPMSCARSCTTSPTRVVARLALRADGTASAVRAFVQNRPVLPWKVWYVAPNFRYERPQKGRYRQHWQVGVEVLGVDDPDIDVEVIALADGFYRELGLRQYRLSLNSMGDAESRSRFRDVLSDYWSRHAARARRGDGARGSEPATHPRLEAGGLAGHDRKGAPDRRVPHARIGEAIRACPGGLAGGRDRLRDRAAAGTRPRLLLGNDVRVRE